MPLWAKRHYIEEQLVGGKSESEGSILVLLPNQSELKTNQWLRTRYGALVYLDTTKAIVQKI